MGLFDIFTGGNVGDAAAQQQAYYNLLGAQVNNQINQAQTQGINALQSGQYQGANAINTGLNSATGAITGALDPSLAYLLGGTNAASSALTGAVNPALAALTSGVSGATGAYGPLAAYGSQLAGYVGPTSQAQADALGLNGPEGVTRAQTAFQTSPGFQFQLNTGLDALNRTAAAGGQGTLGGNVLRQGQVYGQGLAQQEWQNYLNNINQRIQDFTSPAISALSGAGTGIANALLSGGTGAANIFTGTGQRLADLLSGAGTGAAGLITGAGTNLANLATGAGTNLANLFSRTGGNIADLISGLTKTQTGFEGNLAQPYAQTYMTPALADLQGSQNLLNLLGNAATAGVKLYTGGK